jgi:hypothetical protein
MPAKNARAHVRVYMDACADCGNIVLKLVLGVHISNSTALAIRRGYGSAYEGVQVEVTCSKGPHVHMGH